MNEQDHHDEFYGSDADRVLSSVPLVEGYRRAIALLDQAGLLGPHATVLSLGCGDGRFELALAPKVGKVVGVDISPVAVREANRRARAAGIDHFEARVGDLTKLELATTGERFDVICAMGLLHHLPDDVTRAVIADCRGRLKSGGAFFSADPSARRFIRHFAGLVKRSYEKFHSPDEHELSPEATRAAFVESGYRTADIAYFDYFMIPIGYLWPTIPPLVARPMVSADQILCRLPFIQNYASSFAITARA